MRYQDDIDIFEELKLDDNDMTLLEQIDKEIESTLKNIRIFDLQTNKRMTDLLTNEINKQGERINALVDMASPELKEYIVGRMNKIKDTYLN